MVFGDVLLSEESIRERNGVSFNPGAGGWPTIRYFNAETGIGGAPYEKKTDQAMCSELKDTDHMFAYVEGAASTLLCNTVSGVGCTDDENKYIKKWAGRREADYASQTARLEKMMAGDAKLTAESLAWMKARKKLLGQLRNSATNEL